MAASIRWWRSLSPGSADRPSCSWTSRAPVWRPPSPAMSSASLQDLRQQGITLVVVEQNARRVLQYCDYAFVLREGRLAFEGTAEACLQDEETIKGYLGVH